MTSPAKRPAVTYQRGPSRKIPSTAASASPSPSSESESISSSLSSTVLNADIALQQKINNVLFSNSKENKMTIPSPNQKEEEFDSAYHETIGNAKKVHDLVQVGETRRFIDEIEYLLDGLITSGSKSSDQTIRCSIEEIVEKCFSRYKGEFSVNVGFGMKLKSHGALGIIFESLNDTTDPIVLNNLILLISALLYDVRRFDFFFKPELAIKISKHCFDFDVKLVDNQICEMLKCTQIFNKNTKTFDNPFVYFSIWLLSKWAFSSVTTTRNNGRGTSDNNGAIGNTYSSYFFDLLLNDKDLIKKLIETCEIFNETGEKAASLLDYLLNRKLLLIDDSLIFLLDKIILKSKNNINFMKLAVSLTGSSMKIESKTFYFDLIKNLIKNSFPLKGDEVEILYLSCLINLIDRSDDTLMDEFRIISYSDLINDDQISNNSNEALSTCTSKKLNSYSLLQIITMEYINCPFDLQLQKSLLSLTLGFICRQNRTNIEIMSKTINNDNLFNELKKEIMTVSSNFLLQQQQQQQKDEDEDEKIVIERLNEIILTFKK